LNTPARPTAKAWTFVLIGLIVVVLGVRLSFVGRGAMAFPDEERYYQALEAIKSFTAGHVKAGFAHLVHTQGRPGEALLRMLPAAAQGIWYTLGGPSSHAPVSLLLPVLFTYGISVVALLLYYRLARMLSADKLGALLTTLVYACLVNSNLYIRHVLPYDLALCSFFALLVWLLREEHAHSLPTWKAYLLGAGATFTFTIYPGYFFVPVVVMVVLLSSLATNLRSRVYKLVAFGAGALSVLGSFEMLGQLTHYSYFQSCLHLSGSIIQGDFQESFSFAFKYLAEVEGWLGYLLLMLAGMRVLGHVYQARRSNNGKLKADGPRTYALYLGMLGSFLAYAALGYWGHKLVFYGRILHLFLPFLVLFGVGASWQMVGPRARLPFAVLLMVVALSSFGRFAVRYRAVQYPIDLLLQPAAGLARQKTVFISQSETSDNDNYVLAQQHLASQQTAGGEAILVNFSFLYPIAGPGCNDIPLPAGYQEVLAVPHFLTFPAYNFEGFAPHERAMLRRCQYQCKVYVRP